MSKSVRIDDDLYDKIEEFALKEDRPVANALVRLIKLGLGLSEPSENKKVEIPNWVGSQANNTDNSEEIRRLIEERRRLVFRLRDENLSREIQQMAVENCWTDEQAEEEAIRLRADLEREVDAVNEQLKSLGVI